MTDKFCVDCKHYSDSSGRWLNEMFCDRFSDVITKTCLVTGSKDNFYEPNEEMKLAMKKEFPKREKYEIIIKTQQIRLCSVIRKLDSLCGPEGKYFEPAEKLPPPPPPSLPRVPRPSKPKPKSASFLKRLFS